MIVKDNIVYAIFFDGTNYKYRKEKFIDYGENKFPRCTVNMKNDTIMSYDEISKHEPFIKAKVSNLNAKLNGIDEIKLLYNALDDMFYLYIGEDYYGNTSHQSEAIMMMNKAINHIKNKMNDC